LYNGSLFSGGSVDILPQLWCWDVSTRYRLDKLLKLRYWFLPGVNWLNLLLFMPRWFLLRCSEFVTCHLLLSWHVFSSCIGLCLLIVSRGQVLIVTWRHLLHALPLGNLFSFFGIFILWKLYCGSIL